MAEPTNNILHHEDNIVYVGIDPNKLESFQGESLKDCLQNLIDKFCKVEEEKVDVKLFANDSICDKIIKEELNDEVEPADTISAEENNVLFSCPIPTCDFRTHLKKSVTRHLKETHGPKTVICDVCSKKYRTESQLRKHFKDRHSDIIFNCDICEFKSTRKNEVTRHKRRVHEKSSRDFTCEYCGFTSKYNQTLDDHKQAQHGNPNDPDFLCDECSYTTKVKRALVKHKNQHRKKNNYTFTCQLCSEKLKTEKSLLSHEKMVHGIEHSNKCDQCDYNPAKKSNLKKHKLSAHGNLEFLCTHCPWKTKEKSNLNKHLRMKHNL